MAYLIYNISNIYIWFVCCTLYLYCICNYPDEKKKQIIYTQHNISSFLLNIFLLTQNKKIKRNKNILQNLIHTLWKNKTDFKTFFATREERKHSVRRLSILATKTFEHCLIIDWHVYLLLHTDNIQYTIYLYTIHYIHTANSNYHICVKTQIAIIYTYTNGYRQFRI